MKKFTILVLTAIIISMSLVTVSNAQLSYGVKGGVSHSAFKHDDRTETSTKTGFVAGAFISHPIIENLDIQLEALYTQVGAKQDVDGRTGKYLLNYASLPLVAKYNVWRGIYAVAGGQFGYLLSAKTELGGKKESIRENLKKTDIGLVFGGGYEMGNGLGAELRYNPGTTDISRSDVGVKNVAWQLTLSYRLAPRK